MLDTNPFVAKLDRLMSMTVDERTAASNVPIRLANIGKDQDVVREGDRPSRCVLVVDGLLATSKFSVAGKRQTISYHIAGDIPDLLSLHLEVLDSDVRTVTTSTVAFIDNSAIRGLCERHPKVAATLWKATLVEAAIFREWCVNLGQRAALNRMAHLFCEIMTRMDSVGLAQDNVCAFNVTQGDLGEAIGLSIVHINRMLQELRGRGLISFDGLRLVIYDWSALIDLAEFRPDYLHLGLIRHSQPGPPAAA